MVATVSVLWRCGSWRQLAALVWGRLTALHAPCCAVLAIVVCAPFHEAVHE